MTVFNHDSGGENSGREAPASRNDMWWVAVWLLLIVVSLATCCSGPAPAG